MKISIIVKMDPPPKNKYPSRKEVESTVEEDITDAIEAIESGHESVREWKLINKFARELRGRKDERSCRLLKRIEPVLQKYGVHGNHSVNDEV